MGTYKYATHLPPPKSPLISTLGCVRKKCSEKVLEKMCSKSKCVANNCVRKQMCSKTIADYFIVIN